eukprot:gene382-695_t
MFNGEPMALHRLFYLQDVVDHFILTESNVTLSGKAKSAYFLDKYSSFLKPLVRSGKVIPLKVTFPNFLYSSPKNESWVKEAYLRNFGHQYALNMMGSSAFIAIVSDADEVPRRSVIKNLRMNYTSLDMPVHFEMSLFYYSFTWRKQELWYGAYAANDKYVRSSVSSLHQGRTISHGKVFRQGGWHCSYCMTATDIVTKLKSSPHVELDVPMFTNVTWVEQCRVRGLDLFRRVGGVHDLQRYDGSDGYPHCKACRTLPGHHVLEIPSAGRGHDRRLL